MQIVTQRDVRRGTKLVSLLKPGMKVLLQFGHIDHGMGDCVMFWSVYQQLKRLYPQVIFNLRCRKGQELFNDITQSAYDLLFQVPMTQLNNGLSKSRICAQAEIGIPWKAELDFSYKLPEVKPSNIPVPENTIGLSFQSVSNPRKRLSADKAQLIWNCVKQAGFIPLQVHFQHIYKIPQNTRYTFTDFTCRDFPASVQNCIDVIRRLKGFIGVNTGTFCMAATLFPERTLHLSTTDHWSPKFQEVSKVSQISCNPTIDIQGLKYFIQKCK